MRRRWKVWGGDEEPAAPLTSLLTGGKRVTGGKTGQEMKDKEEKGIKEREEKEKIHRNRDKNGESGERRGEDRKEEGKKETRRGDKE